MNKDDRRRSGCIIILASTCHNGLRLEATSKKEIKEHLKDNMVLYSWMDYGCVFLLVSRF